MLTKRNFWLRRMGSHSVHRVLPCLHYIPHMYHITYIPSCHLRRASWNKCSVSLAELTCPQYLCTVLVSCQDPSIRDTSRLPATHNYLLFTISMAGKKCLFIVAIDYFTYQYSVLTRLSFKTILELNWSSMLTDVCGVTHRPEGCQGAKRKASVASLGYTWPTVTCNQTTLYLGPGVLISTRTPLQSRCWGSEESRAQRLPVFICI